MMMSTEETFIKVLQMHGIEHAFGIIGSAMMPISDLFPEAGITVRDCAHETSGGMMADGYPRATAPSVRRLPGDAALETAVEEQMNGNVTTFIEVVLNQELGEPFRRDAMTAPNRVAGIDKADMRPQPLAS